MTMAQMFQGLTKVSSIHTLNPWHYISERDPPYKMTILSSQLLRRVALLPGLGMEPGPLSC